MKTIHVVAGAMFGVDDKSSCVLLGKRRPDVLRPGLWEMPGGKVEGPEPPKMALEREWMEELALAITVHEMITRAVIDIDELLIVDLYHVRAVAPKPEPQNLDHVDLMWTPPEDAIRNVACSPAMYFHYRALQMWMRSAAGRFAQSGRTVTVT